MKINFYKKIVIALCLVFVGIFGAAAVQAQQIEFEPQVDIPGVNTAQVQPDGSTRAIGEYIKGIYNYGIGIVAILATAVMMFGGFQWIIAGGNAEKIGEAKAWLGAALTGLVLALGSFTILNLINPNLTSLTVTDISDIDKIKDNKIIGCCSFVATEDGQEKQTCFNTTHYDCDQQGGLFSIDKNCINNKQCSDKDCQWLYNPGEICANCGVQEYCQPAGDDSLCGIKTNSNLNVCCCRKDQ
jgi:hypothetical protein